MTHPLESPTGRYHIWTRADRLRVARESLPGNVTQAELAERMGVGRNTVGRYESLTDSTPVKESTIKLWALATGFDYRWLMTGEIPGDGKPDTPPSEGATAFGCKLYQLRAA